MNPESFRSRDTWLVFAALLHGLLIWAILPDGVVALNDDFGYLKSVIHTLQRHRPWTDDWLEPWGASFAWLSASLFRATRHFQFATYGLLALLAAVSFHALSRLWRERSLSVPATLLASALLATFPTLLWKSLEFTAVALYVPCLLLAISAAEHGRWGRFMAVWLIAAASRQSALAWLAFPGTALLESLLARPRATGKDWRLPAAAIAIGLTFIVVMGAVMNKTHSQRVRTDHVLQMMNAARFFHSFGTGLLVFAGAAGIGRFALWATGAGPARPWRASLPHTLAGLGFIALPFVIDLSRLTSPEHPAFGPGLGGWYLRGLPLLAGAGWLIGGFRLRSAHALAALASVVLVAIRGSWWDYYFLDPMLLGLFGISLAAPGSDAVPAPPAGRRSFALLLLIPLVAAHLAFTWTIKLHLDVGSSLCRLYETAMREGKLDPTDMRSAPFGLAAWHLFPYFATHKGRNTPSIGALVCHLRERSVVAHLEAPPALTPRSWPLEPEPPPPAIPLGRRTQKIGWFFDATCSLWRIPEAPDAAPDHVPVKPAWRFTPFPLSETEWKELSLRSPRQF